jgi:hypothetical protein
MTRFKELCLDVHGDPVVMGEFWSAATGVPYVPGSGPDDPGNLVGELEGQGIALSSVPETKTVKHRVHIDVHADAVDTLLALGATEAPGYDNPDDPWTVLLDPEGGELCAFLRDDLPAYRLYELCVDCVNGERMARWWADVFDVEPLNQGRTYWWIEGVPGMPFELMVFDTVPEPKTVKNRIHWDVHGDVDDLLARGATHLADQPRWTVLADPEGNEFCVFAEK